MGVDDINVGKYSLFSTLPLKEVYYPPQKIWI